MDKKNKRKKVKKQYWFIVLMITAIFTMWIYGMVQVYMPSPWDIGFGQYLDVGVGIVLISLVFFGFIIGIIFKNNKKK